MEKRSYSVKVHDTVTLHFSFNVIAIRILQCLNGAILLVTPCCPAHRSHQIIQKKLAVALAVMEPDKVLPPALQMEALGEGTIVGWAGKPQT